MLQCVGGELEPLSCFKDPVVGGRLGDLAAIWVCPPQCERLGWDQESGFRGEGTKAS